MRCRLPALQCLVLLVCCAAVAHSELRALRHGTDASPTWTRKEGGPRSPTARFSDGAGGDEGLRGDVMHVGRAVVDAARTGAAGRRARLDGDARGEGETAAPAQATRAAPVHDDVSSWWNVTRLEPSWGSTDGGFVVTVTGDNFTAGDASSTVARLWGIAYALPSITTSKVVVHNATHLSLTMPSFPCESPTYVELSFNGGRNWSAPSANATFSFLQFFSAAVELYPTFNTAATANLLVQVADAVQSLGGRPTLSAKWNGVTLIDAADVVANGSKQAVAFPLQPFAAEGNFTLDVVLRDAGGAWSLARQVPFLLVAPSDTAVVVDRRTRALRIGGVNTVMSGWFIDSRSSLPRLQWKLRDMAQRGFNMAIDYRTELTTDADLAALLQTAAEVGVYVQVGLSELIYPLVHGDGPIHGANYTYIWDNVTRIVTNHRSSPGVLGWYITDDTVPDWPARVQAVYAYIKQLDPYHPVFNTFSGSGQAWSFLALAGVGYDVPQYEAYFSGNPIYQQTTIPLVWPNNFVPAFICAQGFFSSPSQTLQAVASQTAISFMFGATGIVWWEAWTWTMGTMGDLYSTAQWSWKPYGALTPALLGPHGWRSFAIDAAEGDVAAVGWWEDAVGGCLRVSVVNRVRAPTVFTLSSRVLAAYDHAVAMFEGRSVDVLSSGRNGTIAEALGTLESRLYALGCDAIDGEQQDAPALLDAPLRNAPTDGQQVTVLRGDQEGREAAAPGKNLVYNAGFASTTVALLPDGALGNLWLVKGFPAAPGANAPLPIIAVDPSTAAVGRHSLRLVAPTQFPSGTVVEVPAPPLQNATTYNISLWVRFPALAASAPPSIIDVTVVDGQELITLWSVRSDAQPAWEWRQHAAVAAGTSHSVYLRLRGVGRVWLDDVWISELSSRPG